MEGDHEGTLCIGGPSMRDGALMHRRGKTTREAEVRHNPDSAVGSNDVLRSRQRPSPDPSIEDPRFPKKGCVHHGIDRGGQHARSGLSAVIIKRDFIHSPGAGWRFRAAARFTGWWEPCCRWWFSSWKSRFAGYWRPR